MARKVSNIDPAERAFDEQLERWGIDRERAKQLGLTLIKGKELERIYVPGRNDGADYRPFILAAIAIPYFDAEGELRQDPALARSKYCVRYRYLTQPGAFNTQPPDEFGKYAQEAGTLPWAYLPRPEPEAEWSWPVVQRDPTKPIIITEGEMKAATAVQYGYVCIGLGGVWSFRSTKHGIGWLPELQAFEWKKREVIINYDSDVIRNPQVRLALEALADELLAKGAMVFVAELPETIKHSETGDLLDKVGLDDYIIHMGVDAWRTEVLDKAMPLTAVLPLFEMSERFAYINTLNAIYDMNTDAIIQAQAISNRFSFVNFHHITYVPPPPGSGPNTSGGLKMKRENIGRVWMDWPLRNNAQDLTYEPGEERIIVDEGERLINVWAGWGCEPKRGEVKPFLELIDHVLASVSPEHRKWFLQWLAYPIQHPGAKLNQACVIYGPQGSGKTMIGELIGLIYGKNYRIIGQDQLASQFNEWMHGLQFIMGDEISGTGSADHRRVADKLKHYITGLELTINRKNANLYTLPNHCNFYFTSNHPDAFFLENNDRRYFICKTPEQRETGFYDRIAEWRDSGGVEALFYHLLHLDLSGFDAKANAPMTDAKLDMMNSSKSNLGLWLADLVGADDIRIGKIKCDSDLYTTKQLRVWYEAETDQKTTDQAVSMELKRMGVQLVCGGGQVRFSAKSPLSKARLWAIRNHNKWLKATESECAKHYEAKFASIETIGEAVKKDK